MAKYPTLTDRLKKAFAAAQHPLDLPMTNQVLLAIATDLRLYSAAHRDEQDLLPKMKISFDQFRDGPNNTSSIGTLVEIGDARESSKHAIFCNGLILTHLDQVQHALVTITGGDHQPAIGDLVQKARDRVYSQNPVRRFVEAFKNPGPEILT